MSKGTYALLLCMRKQQWLKVGRLGRVSFPSGYYVYVGSALGGLEQRIRRHLHQEKKLSWHIDYLLTVCDLVEVWYTIREERLECLWSQLLASLPKAQILCPGFGSSDCSCPSHLIYFPSPPSFEAWLKVLAKKDTTFDAISCSCPHQKWSALGITSNCLGSGSPKAGRLVSSPKTN